MRFNAEKFLAHTELLIPAASRTGIGLCFRKS